MFGPFCKPQDFPVGVMSFPAAVILPFMVQRPIMLFVQNPLPGFPEAAQDNTPCFIFKPSASNHRQPMMRESVKNEFFFPQSAGLLPDCEPHPSQRVPDFSRKGPGKGKSHSEIPHSKKPMPRPGIPCAEPSTSLPQIPTLNDMASQESPTPQPKMEPESSEAHQPVKAGSLAEATAQAPMSASPKGQSPVSNTQESPAKPLAPKTAAKEAPVPDNESLLQTEVEGSVMTSASLTALPEPVALEDESTQGPHADHAEESPPPVATPFSKPEAFSPGFTLLTGSPILLQPESEVDITTRQRASGEKQVGLVGTIVESRGYSIRSWRWLWLITMIALILLAVLTF